MHKRGTLELRRGSALTGARGGMHGGNGRLDAVHSVYKHRVQQARCRRR